MPTPYPFVSGATLLASQMNSLSQLPTVSITANSTAVATHAYSRVIANGSAITYTIPNSVFEAGQVIEFHNINSTACTIAAGAGVTLNGAAGLTVAQYQAATIYATSASSFILFESDVTQTAAGLELVSSTTIGNAVSTVTVSSAFSSTYDNYKIIVSGGAASGAMVLNLQMGSTTSGYYLANSRLVYSGGTDDRTINNGSSWELGAANANGLSLVADLVAPNLAKNTFVFFNQAVNSTTSVAGAGGGFLNDTTQYTAFTITTSTGTVTGGTIKVYGYRN